MTLRPLAHRSRSGAVSIWIAALVLCACNGDPPPEPIANTPASSPIGGLQSPATDEAELTGIVAEHLDAGRYSYLRVDDHGKSRWIATTGEGARVGERVHVRSFGTRRDFDSPRLGRRFDELVFGIVRVTPSPEKT